MRIIVVLLSLVLCNHALAAQPDTHSVDLKSLTASEQKAREFFLQSTRESLEHLTDSDTKPIQVDLYILVHFLMYNDKLQFTDKPEEAKEISKQIIDYFKKQLENDTLMEGCLAAKLLIALAQRPAYQEFEKALADKYLSAARERWNGEGIGECFVTGITRSYGGNTEEFYCTPVATQELAAKTTYYLTTSKLDQNRYKPLGLKHINETPYKSIDDWWKANVELWVIDTYQLTDQQVISHKRYQDAVKLVDHALKQSGHDTLTLSLLANAQLLADKTPSAEAIEAIKKVMSTQAANGAIPSSIAPDKPGHNFDASPTYMYLLAVDALKEKL